MRRPARTVQPALDGRGDQDEGAQTERGAHRYRRLSEVGSGARLGAPTKGNDI